MNTDVLVRLGLSIVLIGLGLGLYKVWNGWQLRRLARGGQREALRGLEGLRPGVPGVLYFTTPDCQVCITAQRPALRRLEAELGDGLQLVEVDASVRTDLADYWGVLSVPTTFIIDGAGQPKSINHGLTSKEKLQRQLEAAQSKSAAPIEADAESVVVELER